MPSNGHNFQCDSLRHCCGVKAVYLGVSDRVGGVFLTSLLRRGDLLLHGLVRSRADGLVEGIFLFLIMIALIPLVTRLRMQAFHHYGAIGLLKQEYRWVALFNGAQSSFAANSLVRIAKIHEMLNHHENALLTYQTIETTFPSFANRGRGGVMLHRAIGQSLMRLGRLPEALESHRVALQLTKAHHAHAILIQADLNAIAGIFELMGNLPAALAKRLEAWCVLEEIGHTQSAAAAICLTRMAHTYELMGDLDVALKKLETALRIFIAIEGEFPRSTTVARLYTRIGNLQVAMGNPAVEIFRHAIEVYRRSGMSDEHSALANLLRRSEAIEHV